jgi:hypothetical protein
MKGLGIARQPLHVGKRKIRGVGMPGDRGQTQLWTYYGIIQWQGKKWTSNSLQLETVA